MSLSSLKIRDASGWTMFIFGVLAFVFGAVGLVSPETLLRVLGFQVIERTQRAAGDYTLTFIAASSMASFNIGVYYVLAALNDMKKFYLWTVPFRAVTFTVFTLLVVTGFAPVRFWGVGLWELAGAVATGLALYFEREKA
jgi:Na+-driven multidrug efflux pump